MPKKLTIDIVEKEFNNIGYTLLTKVYKGSGQSFDYLCNKGHEGKMRLDHLRRGVSCAVCSGNKRLTLDFITKSFEVEGYELVSKKYINSHTKLKYICPKGHRGSVSWNNWGSGNRCSVCFGTHKPKFKDIKDSFENEGYVLLSKEYINKNTKLISICPNGHKYEVSWEGWERAKSRCRFCYMERIMPTVEKVRASFEAEGYKLLSTKYINANSKLKCVCTIGHVYNTTWSNWQEGHRCKKCYSISISGKRNYNWKGGISFEPYPIYWTKQLKDSIKARDRNKCLNPDCCNQDETISVHHIDYNKKNCKLSNLITVCRSCNARANKDRAWHKSWYQAILKNRYNYESEKELSKVN